MDNEKYSSQLANQPDCFPDIIQSLHHLCMLLHYVNNLTSDMG